VADQVEVAEMVGEAVGDSKGVSVNDGDVELVGENVGVGVDVVVLEGLDVLVAVREGVEVADGKGLGDEVGESNTHRQMACRIHWLAVSSM
jgi:hypothetical protein